MKKFAILFITVFLTVAYGQNATIHSPFETSTAAAPLTDLDKFIFDKLVKEKITPANVCSDEVFVRRVFVDAAGMIPAPEQTLGFLSDTDPAKRGKLIDQVLQSQGFIDYTTMKWCNTLRVKSEFPINLWPNAVQAYHRWITEAVSENIGYDEFARQLLTSSGSNFRNPPVNFYRAIQGRTPADIAAAACLTFMGVRLDKQSEEFTKNMEPFFSRVAYKGTGEWKEEIIYLDSSKNEPLNAVFPDGTKVTITPGNDPRKVFADWLITPENKWFNRSIVNRLWQQFFGRGIIDPADDISDDNKPSNPQLLAYLENELIKSGYDLKHVCRVILSSRTYQLSSIPQSSHPKAEALFAFYPARKLDAEVLIDALCDLGGKEQNYLSMIPEPFTYIPGQYRTVALADGSITSQFLEMFGRPSRDSGLISERNNQPTDFQLLHVLNSTEIHDLINNNPSLNEIVNTSKKEETMVRQIYLLVLSRYPTGPEMETFSRYAKEQKLWKKGAAQDLMWALINTKEFLYRH